MATNLSRPGNAESLRTKSPLVLASASPRRSEILHGLGFEFEVVPSDIDEDLLHDLEPVQLAKALADLKAESVSILHPETCVIGADTVVEFEGESLGKPSSGEEAVSMLQRLSGNSHSVHTGLAVRFGATSLSEVETTEVTVRELADSEIEAYVHSGAALDKAGAYGIQDDQFSPVESFSGSYLNVVGLPAGLLANLLLQAGEIEPAAAADLMRRDSI